MAAVGSSWVTAVVCRGRMTLAFSLLLLLLVGLPREGDSSIPVVKSKTPTAEECRPHVEKAVDQYFGSKPGDQTATEDDTSTHIQTPPTDDKDNDDDDDDDNKNPPITTPDKNKTDEDDEDDDDDEKEKNKDDDDDDDDDEEDLSKKSNKDDEKELLEERTEDVKDTKEADKIVEDNNEDNDNDDDDYEDDEDNDNDVGVDQTVKIDANIVEDDEDEDDDEEEEDEINDDNRNLNGNADDDDNDDDEDNNVITKDNITKASEHRPFEPIKNHHHEVRATKVTPNDEEEDEDDDDDEEDDDDEDSSKDDDDEDSSKDDDDDDDGDTSKKGDDDSRDAKKEEINEEKKPIYNIPKISEVKEEKKPTYNIPKIQIIRSVTPEKTDHKEKESEKATGGPDPVTTRVAQELPRSQPPTEQPKASEVSKEAQAVIKPSVGGTNQTQQENKTTQITTEIDDDDEDDDDDDLIENIYEESDDDDDDESSAGVSFRNRAHVDAILNLDHIGTNYDQEEEKLASPIFRDIKKIHAASIKPMEVLYKYTDSTSRLLGDAEIFNKPMILFIGPWSTGKTSIINYLLGIERTPAAFKTGTGITGVDFTVITHGDKSQTISGTELTVDWRYASLQRFGQRFLDHFKAVTVPHTLLKKINIVDTPGIMENRKNLERGYPFNDAFQWFIDRADAIFVVLDPTKIDVGAELGTVVDQLKGREIRFILNKADSIRRSDLMKVVGQLFWNLSPLMGSSEAPVIYAVSLSSKPFNPTAPAKFLADQENNFLFDLKETIDRRVENRILYARRHAVRVRNHAKMVDCYLATYYRHKSIFSNKKNVAKQIIENPKDYQIYEGLGNLSNVSRYDIPDTNTYTDFFRLHPLYDFRPLASTCSYFRGCPMDKLDAAISTELPELLSKYKKAKNISSQVKQEGR